MRPSDEGGGLSGLDDPWPDDVLPQVRGRLEAAGELLVVLDDDPTGSQTVHEVPVLTTWDDGLLASTLSRFPLTFLLTNSRSMDQGDAVQVVTEATRDCVRVAASLGRPLRVISRSDSTLRGHFPAEVGAIEAGTGSKADLCLLAPAFISAGRITVGDVHYARVGETFVPVSETPFAKDMTFGYETSHLPSWIAQKTQGRRLAPIDHLPLDAIRRGGPTEVAKRLTECERGAVVIVNAVAERDLEVVAAAAQSCELEGMRIIARCGASYVRARAGLPVRPMLTRDDIPGARGANGGLIVCGSHVPTSTQQIQRLAEERDVEVVELRVPELLMSERRSSGVSANAAARSSDAIAAGRHALIVTSREVAAPAGFSPLEIAHRVSAAVINAVRAVGPTPAFVIAKGGITSHDVAARALGIRRALVVGQLLTGVSLWQADSGRMSGLPYVVFPGNVGEPDSMVAALRMLSPQPPPTQVRHDERTT